MRGRRLGLWLATVALVALAPRALVAAEPPKAAESKAEEPVLDEELLEFLGSLDLDDQDWIEYLTQTDIAKVAKSARPAPKPATPKSAATPKPPDTAKGETKEGN